MRAGPVISAVHGWRDGFVVGETHVLPAYQGQGLRRISWNLTVWFICLTSRPVTSSPRAGPVFIA